MKKYYQIFLNYKKIFCLFIFVAIFILLIFIFPQVFTLIGGILNKYSSGITALAAILGVISGSSWLDTSK